MASAMFSVKWIEDLEPDGVEHLYWDQKQPGLGLRITSKGKAFFCVQYRIKNSGQYRRVALGAYGTITLEVARERARRFQSAALDGKDLQSEREAKAKRPTFGTIAEQWIDLHVRPKRAARTLADYEAKLRVHLTPIFGKRIVEEIKRSEVLGLHKRMSKTPKVADYTIVVGKAAINFGLKSGLLPAGVPNPFAGIELYGQEGRERFLSEAEVVRIGDAITELQTAGDITPWAAAAIRLLVFTGARKSEILTLRWDWVDVDQSALLLPTSKTGKRRIELNPAAVAVLRSVPRINGNPFVIVGQKPKTHMVNIGVTWKRICAKAEIKNCRIHDLRHTFASFAAADGLSLLMIGKLLGHTVPATTQRYAHLAEAALKRANDALGNKLADLMATKTHTSGEQPGLAQAASPPDPRKSDEVQK